jgi:hypothetical protein
VQKTTDKLSEKPNLRLVTGQPRGAARDLFDIGGCRTPANSFRYGVADLEFRRDGLPRHVWLTAVPSVTWCRRTADQYIPENDRLTYVALFDPDSVVCSEGSTLTSVSPTASRDVMRVRAAVVAPRLIKKTEVIYPVTSRKNREKGVSIYEAVISPTGCIRDLRLLWSSFPLLDISGIEGISHWKYAPATLHGQPVSVYLTVTVTFNLH